MLCVRVRAGVSSTAVSCRRCCSQLRHTAPVFSSHVSDEDMRAMGWDPLWFDRLNPRLKERLPIALQEFEILRNVSNRFSQQLNFEGWVDCLKQDTKMDRLHAFMFNCTRAYKKQKEAEEKLERRKRSDLEMPAVREIHKEKEREFFSGEKIHYGNGLNSLFLRIYNQVMDRAVMDRLISVRQFAPTICCDLQWVEDHGNKARNMLSVQLKHMVTTNLEHRNPVNLQFVNTPTPSHRDKIDILHRHLIPPGHHIGSHIPMSDYPDFRYDRDERSLQEIYPEDKNRIVMLTPGAWKPMSRFNEDNIYVIGGVVDKGSPQLRESTLSYAKKHKLRMERLPLDEHLKWSNGSKSLCLHQVLGILLDVRHTGDWNYALDKWVPKRKLITDPLHREVKAQVRRSKEDRVNYFLDLMNLAQ